VQNYFVPTNAALVAKETKIMHWKSATTTDSLSCKIRGASKIKENTSRLAPTVYSLCLKKNLSSRSDC